MLTNATELTLVIVLINSTVNPGLYLWRIREIRLAVKELLRSMFLRRGKSENIDSGSTLETLSLEPRIRQIEVGSENCVTNEAFTISVGLANHSVFTTHL